jgi:hypothetical protein
MISKSVVIRAVLPSMIEAEQYFFLRELDGARNGFRLQLATLYLVVEVNPGKQPGVGFGAFGVEAHLATGDSMPALLQDEDNVESGAPAGSREHHFHWPQSQVATAGIRGAVHHHRMAATAFRHE